MMSRPGRICIESPAAFGIFIPFESASRSWVGRGPVSGLLGALAKLLGTGCKAVGTSAGATGAGTSLGGGLTAGVNSAGTGVAVETAGGTGGGATTDGDGAHGASSTGLVVSPLGETKPCEGLPTVDGGVGAPIIRTPRVLSSPSV